MENSLLTCYDLYELQVIHFGLMKAPSTFHDMMYHVFSYLLDLGLLVYMDDILVYAKTREEHDVMLQEVLKHLQSNELAIVLEKYEWWVQEVEFLDYIMGQNGVRMSPMKVEVVLQWKRPALQTEVQSFLGFANFYH